MTIMHTNWTRAEIAALFDQPFTELVFRAAEVHRANHAPGEVQLCTLLSIKTGGCPEDCGYCSQSAHAKTGLKAEKLMDVDAVLQELAQDGLTVVYVTHDPNVASYASRVHVMRDGQLVGEPIGREVRFLETLPAQPAADA